MEQQKSITCRIEEACLPEDIMPLVKKFLIKIDEIARKIAQMHDDPSRRGELVDQLCTEGDTYFSSRAFLNPYFDVKIFYTNQIAWSNLFNEVHPFEKIQHQFKDPSHQPYDLSTLNEDQLKDLFNLIYEELSNLSKLSDEKSYKSCILGVFQEIIAQYIQIRSNFAKELFEKCPEIVETFGTDIDLIE